MDPQTTTLASEHLPPQDSNLKSPKQKINTASFDCDEESLLSEASDVAVSRDQHPTLDIEDVNIDIDINAAPMHLHAIRGPVRLTGSFTGLIKVNSEGKLNTDAAIPPTGTRGRRSRSTSRGRPRSSGLLSNSSSRSTSPVTLSSMENPSASGSNIHNTDHHSLDPDILLDKLGFIDLDPPLPHEIRCGPLAAPEGKAVSGGLTPVNERLSEETLEDCHAFTDLGYYKSDNYSTGGMSMPSVTHSCSLSGFGSNMSVGSQSMHSRDTVSVASVQEGSVLGLGRLDEEEDEDEEDLGLEPVVDGEGEEVEEESE